MECTAVRAKIEARIHAMEIPIYQLARQPFFVSMVAGVKALFWSLLFCLGKNLKIGLDGLMLFNGAKPAFGFRS